MTVWRVRDASEADAEGIAEAHVASIRELAKGSYPPDVIESWGAPRDGSGYLAAMRAGSRFFVAASSSGRIEGFASAGYSGRAYLAVYVRGSAARLGIGSALLAEALRVLKEMGAKEVRIEASLNAVAFYERNGFRSHGEDDHRLSTGLPMRCVVMSRSLA